LTVCDTLCGDEGLPPPLEPPPAPHDQLTVEAIGEPVVVIAILSEVSAGTVYVKLVERFETSCVKLLMSRRPIAKPAPATVMVTVITSPAENPVPLVFPVGLMLLTYEPAKAAHPALA
jgi:hypothetical protein